MKAAYWCVAGILPARRAAILAATLHFPRAGRPRYARARGPRHVFIQALTLRILGWTCLALTATLGGCAVAAFTATLFPPKKIPAQYEFDEKACLLVFVEDPKHLADRTSLKTQLTEYLIKDFENRGLVDRVVPYRQLMHLAAATENFPSLSTAEVAKKLKADVVLYVEIDHFSIKDAPNSPFWHGKLTTFVKVIGVKEGRLWPKDLPEGCQTPRVDTGSISDDGSVRFEQTLVKTMAYEMGGNIVKLFYKHRGKEHGALPESDIVDRP